MSNTSSPFTLRWGIISTGGIATSFASDLLVDPSTRDVKDVAHKITAVGSRSVESAEKFISKLKAYGDQSDHASSWGVKQGLLEHIKGYATYEEVFADKNVDAVYIGTPHPMHYKPAKQALEAGKHVLCEKPVTFDLEELEDLLHIAKEKKLFFMEAVWTRFQPVAYEVQEWVHSGKLGKVEHVIANNLVNFDPDNNDPKGRMINPDLGGGAILDLGPYSAVWAMLTLHHLPDNKNPSDLKWIESSQRVYKKTGVDAESSWTVEWPGLAKAVMTAALDRAEPDQPTFTLKAEKADLLIDGAPWRPETYTIVPKEGQTIEGLSGKKQFTAKQHAGGAMHYEADEVARGIKDGKTESERMPWEESRIVQGWFDRVRKDGDTVLKDVKGQVGN